MNLAALLFDVARLLPERPAVSDDRHCWNYRELAERIGRVAGGLRARGLVPGDRVLLSLENCAEFVELLGPRVEKTHPSEMLRRKPRQVGKTQRRSGVQGVADRKPAGVHEADDVAGVGHLDRLAVATEEAIRARGTNRFAEPAVRHDHVLREAAGADTHEGHPIAMPRVHVCLNLEHEPGEALVRRADDADVARARLRLRREVDERLQEGLEAEVGQRAPEEHRRLPPCPIFVQAE